MDLDNILDNSASPQSDFIITDAIRGYLSESARWGKFIAIIGFVFAGLGVIGILVAGGSMAAFGTGAGGGIIILVYLVIMLITVIPIYYLYQFATKMQVALRDNDQIYLQSAFENHKAMFKFYGIFMAIILGIYALALIVGLFAGFAL